MIGSRSINLACLALLGLLAALVPCSSALARDVYVTNSGDGTVTVLEYPSNHVVGSIHVGGEPVDVAITPDGQEAWVVDQAGASVSVINTKTRTVMAGPIAVGKAPRGIAISPNGGRVYVTNSGDDTVSVLNPATFGPVGEPIPVGKEPDGVAFSTDGGTAFVAQRGGGIAVIDTNSAEMVDTIDDSFGPSRIAMTPDGRRGFVTNHLAETVTAFSTAARSALDPPIQVGAEPTGIAMIPNGSFAYAASAVDGTLTQIDTSIELPIGAPIEFPGATGVGFTPDGHQGYVTDGGGSTVSVLDPSRNAPAGAITVGEKPVAVAVVPDQGPTAAFWVSPVASRRAKKRLTFHGSNSTDPDGKILDYSWDFGDRGKADGPQPTRSHSYRRRGTYFVTLKVTDNEGCSTETVFTGQTVSCQGNPAATVTVPIKVLNPTGPKLQVTGRDHQPMRRVVVRARCPQIACSLRAGGIVVTSAEENGRKVRHLRRLASATAPAATRGWRRLVVRVPGPTRHGAEHAVLIGGTAKARVAVTARDRTNEVTVETKVVKLGL
ncbi:MAG TPA: PKD domain-containing protein [Solirubrobacterales bacterium]|jgi:YVTN family beta-propeller protein